MVDSQRGFILRVGDQDDYSVLDDLSDVADKLFICGVSCLDCSVRGGFVGTGIDGESFAGNNYISLFHGQHGVKGSRLERELTAAEGENINEYLFRLKEEI